MIINANDAEIKIENDLLNGHDHFYCIFVFNDNNQHFSLVHSLLTIILQDIYLKNSYILTK